MLKFGSEGLKKNRILEFSQFVSLITGRKHYIHHLNQMITSRKTLISYTTQGDALRRASSLGYYFTKNMHNYDLIMKLQTNPK